MKRKVVLTAIGRSCLDTYYRVDRVPKSGEKVIARFQSQVAGGMIGNAAVVFSAFAGTEVYVVDFLGEGGDTQELLDDFEANGVSLQGIEISDQYVNSRCLILLEDSGERSIVVIPGPSESYEMSEQQIEILKRTDYVYTTPVDLKRIKNLDLFFKIKSQYGFKLVYDVETNTFESEADWKILKYADLIFVNEQARDKLERLFGLEKIIDSVPHIVVTKAERGSESILGSKHYVHNAEPCQVVDTTGAGDTYNAAYVYALAQGLGAESCGAFASILASRKIEKYGPRSGACKVDDIEAFIEQNKSVGRT